MDDLFRFTMAIVLTGFAIIFLCVAGVIAVATYYGIASVIEERREKRKKKKGSK